jgi:hypothetical protein
MVNHLLNRKLLHDLDDERHHFCSLTTVQTDHRKLAMRRRRESSTIVVGVTFGGASASRMAPLVAVMAEGPPPSGGLALEALLGQVDGAAVKGQWWLSFVLARA